MTQQFPTARERYLEAARDYGPTSSLALALGHELDAQIKKNATEPEEDPGYDLKQVCLFAIEAERKMKEKKEKE